MALEKSLWQRVKKGGVALKRLGHGVHFNRIENTAGEGTPDAELWLDDTQIWIELKSEHRPARASTAIRPKVRPAQSIWLKERVEAGCKTAFILLQVGDAGLARLYLIPGHLYNEITATEERLQELSIIEPIWPMTRVLLRAKIGW